jgi:hypothetical protein
VQIPQLLRLALLLGNLWLTSLPRHYFAAYHTLSAASILLAAVFKSRIASRLSPEQHKHLHDHVERASLILNAMESCSTALRAAGAVERALVRAKERQASDTAEAIWPRQVLGQSELDVADSGAGAEQEMFWNRWIAEIDQLGS